MKIRSLAGKNIVITGASTGIGELIAYQVAELGATPVLLARSHERLAKVAEEIKQRYGITPFYYSVDLSNIEEIQNVFTTIQETITSVDTLVNNAGFGKFDYVQEADLAEMEAMFKVNVLGLIACTKLVLPQMIANNSGHIINIASQAGKIATPKSSVYSATKHAVLGFTNSLRMELAETNVEVTSVNPGPIRTRFFDIADKSGQYVKNVNRFMLEPDDVARKIVNVMITPKRELNLPGWMNLGSIFYTLFPTAFEKIGSKALFKK